MLTIACGSGAQPSSSPTTPTSATPPPVSSTYALSGNVRETAPSPTPPLIGARVEIIEGSQAGHAIVTDSTGFYSFTGLTQQTLALRVSMDGYEAEASSAVALSSNSRLDFGLGHVWPPELSRMMQRLPLPRLRFKRAPGSGPSFYVPGAGVVVYVSPAPATGELGSISHELCHAHQDRVRIDASRPSFNDYYDTDEGQNFVESTGWRMQNGAWVEPPCEQWSCGYANPIEDSAQSCATYFNPEGYQFAGADYLQRYAPRRYQWATRWLPTP